MRILVEDDVNTAEFVRGRPRELGHSAMVGDGVDAMHPLSIEQLPLVPDRMLTNIADEHISRLQSTLHEGAKPDRIETRHGVGRSIGANAEAW